MEKLKKELEKEQEDTQKVQKMADINRKEDIGLD